MIKFLYILLAFSIALAIRLYPTFLSGLPFSTDAWSPIRNTELLLKYTPIKLDSEIMDGYNCYWPANSLFGSIFSLITGINPILSMSIGIPLVGALTILIFYSIVSKINSKLAFLSSILLATFYPYSLFMAGVTKETYANPIYMLLILIFLRKWKLRKALLFTIVSLALVMAHHLTVLVAIVILASITLADKILNKKLDNFNPLYVLFLIIITILYFFLYAYRGFKLTITLSDWISIASYQIVTFSLTLYFISKPYKRSFIKTIFICLLSIILASFFAFLCTKRSIIPNAPILPNHYIFYAIPFILISPLIFLGLEEICNMKDECIFLFWFAVIIGLGFYVIFGNSLLGLGLVGRTLNFLSPPLAIIFAFGINRLYLAKYKNLAKLIATTFFLLIIILNFYDIYSAISMRERYMGYYFWLYRIPEYKACEWISFAIDKTIVGDIKISSILKNYFNMKVDIYQGLKYLIEGISKPQIFIYDQMMNNEYNIDTIYQLPKNWMEKVYNLNLIYSNTLIEIYS
jgi:hypothetical protein